MFRRLWLVLLACFLGAAVAGAAEPESLGADLVLLRSSGVSTDGAALLSFFKKRTLGEDVRSRIAAAIILLGADEFQTREKATNDLVDIGPTARPMLTTALRADSAEVRRRARWALDRIGPASSESNLLLAAARVLVHRKPAGAAEVLLNFLPNIEEADVAEEIAQGLSGVALTKDGKPDAALLLALSDRQAIKRYAAANALARVGGATQRAAVRKLLKDADLSVRRRVALSLLELRDKEAVPVLIALVGAGGNEAAAAEEALNTLAGEQSPPAPEDPAPLARERYRKAWEAWWKESGDKIDLAKVDFTGVGRGFTLVALLDVTNINNGKVQELDNEGKVRWTLTGLRYPIHASMARRDRVLICEYYGNRVTERDLKGKVIWEKTVGGQLLSAKRLPNGNTFIAARNLLIEVDRMGREVKSLTRPHDVLSAERYKDGTTRIVTTGQQCVKLDSTGRQVSSFNVGFVTGIIGFKACFLPSGGVIVPEYARNRVREYDASGKLVRDLGVTNRPLAVSRAANGNLMIVTRIGNRVLEIDKAGKEINARTTDGRPMFAERR